MITNPIHKRRPLWPLNGTGEKLCTATWKCHPQYQFAVKLLTSHCTGHQAWPKNIGRNRLSAIRKLSRRRRGLHRKIILKCLEFLVEVLNHIQVKDDKVRFHQTDDGMIDEVSYFVHVAMSQTILSL